MTKDNVKETKAAAQAANKGLSPQLLLAIIALLAVGLVVFAVLYFQKPAAPGADLDNGVENGVVAVVNGEEIAKNDLFDAMYAQGGREILEQLVARKLILQEAEKSGVTISEEDLDAEMEQIIAENFQGSQEEFMSVLDLYGIDPDSFREDARLNLLVRELALTRMDITEEEVREYFEENQDFFGQPEEVEARHILLETEEEADEVMGLLDEGGDFAELAAEYSTDLGSRDSGGSLGFFGRGVMVPEFEEAAFSLAVGERSGIIATDFGFHIIEVLDRREEETREFEEISDEVREAVIDQRVPQVINQLVMELFEEAEIEYLI